MTMKTSEDDAGRQPSEETLEVTAMHTASLAVVQPKRHLWLQMPGKRLAERLYFLAS